MCYNVYYKHIIIENVYYEFKVVYFHIFLGGIIMSAPVYFVIILDLMNLPTRHVRSWWRLSEANNTLTLAVYNNIPCT